MERLLNRNRIFVDRTKGVGVLTKDEAINRSATGPIARASGVTRDLRKDEPYLAYADFDFQVCCATAGDCFARYLVRMAEMRESLKIVEQAIENLPAGPVNVGIDERTALPDKQQVYSTIEGTISHFELVMTNRGFDGAATTRRTRRSKRPTASWAFTWSATAPTWPIGPAAARRRTSTLPCFRT